MKYLMNIDGNSPYNISSQNINIPLIGKNLIITGKNGSGKTSFLKKLNETILFHLSKESQQENDHVKNLKYYQDEILKHKEGSYQYTQGQNNIQYYEDKINKLNSLFILNIENELDLLNLYDKNKFIYRSFEAMRTSKISPVNSSTSIDQEKSNAIQNKSNNLGEKLEQHLVNIRINKAFAFERNDNAQLENLNQWFNNFDDNLKFLFEDDSAKLNFEEQSLKFSIKLEQRNFDFQSLSSGYQAIFDIFSDLLVRTEFFDISPEELQGIILIDEIDAHLHIKKKKKILPFFTNLFPNMQFIVSTHSPFVITSANDNTVVYDISNNEFFEDDLSSYSHESIIKELFHVNPESINLKKSIDYIYNIIVKEPKNKEDLNDLNIKLMKLQPHKIKLNSESKSIYMQALNLLIDNDALGDLDV